MQIRFLVLTLAVFLMQSCGKHSSPTVQYVGALKDIMHRGDISAKVELSHFSNNDALYALGAIENLKGEILILNGKPFVSYVQADSLVVDKSFSKSAALLVFAEVNNWQEVAIPDSIVTKEDVESFILQAAKEKGINIDEPFPFMIKGKISMAQWHVIDWKDGDTEHTPEKHRSSGLRGVLHNTHAQILGFYSDKHQGIFTHHDSNVHLHIVTDDERIAGHMDKFELGDTVLFLQNVDL